MPSELGLPSGYALKVLKPLYGIPESGLHWYLTYLSHHLDTLDMIRTTVDPCVLVRKVNGTLDGLIILQVEDSLGIGSKEILKDEELGSKQFLCKERSMIEPGGIPTSFNGLTITNDGNGYSIKQPNKIDKLQQTKRSL